MPSYLDDKEFADAYVLAKKTARQEFLKFDEYERLAANEVRGDLPKNMPKVTDGSLAALLRETPMRVLAQMMTGNVKVLDRDEAWIAELVNILWSRIIIPNANTDAPFLSKLQTALTRALTYGSQPMYSFFVQRGNYTGADFALPYIRNIYLEPGKVSDLASDYIFMDSYFTKLQLTNILANAIAEEEAAVSEKRPSNNTWDIKELQNFINTAATDKDSQNKNPFERNGDNRADRYKLSTCFNRGFESPFYTFAPNMSNTKLATNINKNPTGDTPIVFMYADQDLFNPYGVGQVQLSGSTQNVLDYLTSADMLATQIGLQPPIQVSGDRSTTDLRSMTYAPQQFWFTGNANVELMQTASNVYQQLPNRYGLYKSQLQNLQGTTDASISSDSGNPSFSKTQAGVQLQQQRSNAHDNFLRQRVNEAFERLAKNMINEHISNMEGSEVITLLDDEVERMSKTGIMPTNAAGQVDTNELEIIWDNMRGSFDFEVDPDSSIVKDDNDQVEKITEALQAIGNNPLIIQGLQTAGYDTGKLVGGLAQQLITKMGLQDTEKILVRQEATDGTDLDGGMGQDDQVQQLIEAARAQGIPDDMIQNYLTTGHAAGAQQ